MAVLSNAKFFVIKIEMIPLAEAARVLRTSGTVQRRRDKPAGEPPIPEALVAHRENLHAGDEVRVGDQVTLLPGSRLTLRMPDGEVADYIAPWDDERRLSFISTEEFDSATAGARARLSR